MGLLVAIEGIDGSGKGTQAARLRDRLVAEGRTAALVSFPRYSETFFGSAIGEYLNGRFGPLAHVDPHLAAALFAGDRFESRPYLEELLASHDVVVADRYVPSNVAHQGARVGETERPDLVDWILRLEHDVYSLPRPDLVILLDVPVAVAVRQIAAKSRRDYTERAADLHEADEGYLDSVLEAYRLLARRERNWQTVSGARDAVARPIAEIGDEIAGLVHERLQTET